MNGQSVDVVVIGGGVAGLSGALTLARSRRSVIVIDEGHPRNAPAAHSHGYLTRDGASPLDLVAIGRAEVAAYGVDVAHDRAELLTRAPTGGFDVRTARGRAVRARRLLAATGLVDQLPAVTGLAERWGRDVLHCPYCFGWEVRDTAMGVLASGPRAVEGALMWRQWSPDLIFLLHTSPPLTGEEAAQLAARGIRVVEGEVAAVKVDDDRLVGVQLVSGEMVARDVVVVSPRFESRHGLLGGLGVTVVVHPLGIGTQVQTEPGGRAAPGIWVAGNLADITGGVMQSAASGVTAAAALNADLTAEDTRFAIEAKALNEPSHPVQSHPATV
jgi:thioredoxin reductase